MCTPEREAELLRMENGAYDETHICMLTGVRNFDTCPMVASYRPGTILFDHSGTARAAGDVYVCTSSLCAHVCNNGPNANCMIVNEGDYYTCKFTGRCIARCESPDMGNKKWAALVYRKGHCDTNAIHHYALDAIGNNTPKVAKCRRNRSMLTVYSSHLRRPGRKGNDSDSLHCPNSRIMAELRKIFSDVFVDRVVFERQLEADIQTRLQYHSESTQEFMISVLGTIAPLLAHPIFTGEQQTMIIAAYAKILERAWELIINAPMYRQSNDPTHNRRHIPKRKQCIPRIDVHCYGFLYVLMKNEVLNISIPQEVLALLAKDVGSVQKAEERIASDIRPNITRVVLCVRDEFLATVLSTVFDTANKTCRESRPKSHVNTTKRIYQAAILSYVRYLKRVLCQEAQAAATIVERLEAVQRYDQALQHLSLVPKQQSVTHVLQTKIDGAEHRQHGDDPSSACTRMTPGGEKSDV